MICCHPPVAEISYFILMKAARPCRYMVVKYTMHVHQTSSKGALA